MSHVAPLATVGNSTPGSICSLEKPYCKTLRADFLRFVGFCSGNTEPQASAIILVCLCIANIFHSAS